jgi:hypothetical protein
MKLIFTLFIALTSFSANAQWGDLHWSCNFEPSSDPWISRFVLDTTYHNNTWQIGNPSKLLFDSALSLPNAIVTDTANPYPINDTSVFVIKHGKTSYSVVMFSLRFRYKLDIDPGEIAKLEVSGDSGLHWVDVLKEDTAYDFTWYSNKPNFDTSTLEWQDVYLNMSQWSNNRFFTNPKTYLSEITADTFLFKFTFISDGNQTNKDGWMMDNFIFDDHPGKIAYLQNNNLIAIHPNPSDGHIYIQQNSRSHNPATVSVYSAMGQEVYKTNEVPQDGHVYLPLPPGIYYLRYAQGEEYAVKQISITY